MFNFPAVTVYLYESAKQKSNRKGWHMFDMRQNYETWAAEQKAAGRLLPSEQTPNVTSEFPMLCSVFEISRRGSLGGSGLVTDGKALIYIGIDLQAQQEQDARNREIGFGSPEPEAPIETKPYSVYLAKRSETEDFVCEGDPRIVVTIDDYAYLEREPDGFDPYVRVLMHPEAVTVAVAA